MDNKERLIPFLEELGQELEGNFNRINWGGCCVVAGLIGDHLQNFTDTKVVLFNGYGEVDLDEARENIIATMGDISDKKAWDKEGCHFSHVLLEIEVDGTFYLVDSERVTESEGYHKYDHRAAGYFTMEETHGMSQAEHGWNSAFDRGQIPHIEETTNDAFERFAKEVSSC